MSNNGTISLHTKEAYSVATIWITAIKWLRATGCWLTDFFMYNVTTCILVILSTIAHMYMYMDGNPVVMYPSTIARGHWMCFCQVWRCLTVSTPRSMQPWRSWTQRQPRWLKTKSHFCPIMLKLCSWWKTSELYSRTWKRLHLVNPVHPHDPRSDTLHVPYMFRSDMSFIAWGDIVHQVYIQL